MAGSNVALHVNNLLDREYVASCFQTYGCFWAQNVRPLQRQPSVSNFSGHGYVPVLQVGRDVQENHIHSDTHLALRSVAFRVPGRTLYTPLVKRFPQVASPGLIGHTGSGKSTLLQNAKAAISRPKLAIRSTISRWRAEAARRLPAKVAYLLNNCRRRKE